MFVNSRVRVVGVVRLSVCVCQQPGCQHQKSFNDVYYPVQSVSP